MNYPGVSEEIIKAMKKTYLEWVKLPEKIRQRKELEKQWDFYQKRYLKPHINPLLNPWDFNYKFVI